MFTKISLIIPTHNRHKFLTRVLDYYKNCEIEVFIADSSLSKYSIKNIENYSTSYNMFKINYYHYPNYEYFDKLADIIQKVKTEYVVMCADDDFILPSAIEKCVDYLDENPNYSSVQGYYASFINTYNGIHFFSTYPSLRNYKIDANAPEKRVENHMSKYMHLFYSVHRINNLKQTFSLTPTIFSGLIEIALSLISVINGKHKMLPFLYNIRESMPNSGSSTIDRLNTIVKNPTMKEGYKSFINSISKHLSENSAYSFENSKEVITTSLDIFIKRRESSIQRTIIKPTILQRINNKMIMQLGPVIPNLSNKLLFRKRRPHYQYFSSKYRSDFIKIKSHIILHSNNRNIILIRIKDFYKLFISFMYFVLKGFK